MEINNNDIRNINIKVLPRNIGQIFEYLTDPNSRTVLKIPKTSKWDVKKQSRFIESLILEMPIIPIYIEECEDDSWVAFDGAERLSTIYNFLSGNLALEGLEIFTQYEGNKFDDFPKDIKRRINSNSINVLLIGKQTPSNIKSILYNRLHN